MAGHTYVTKANNYNDFPAQQGGYAYGPERQANWYVVETRTIERLRVPASGYTKWGAPLEVSYDSDYENSSPSRYHERENLMADFLNKLQIGASPPMKTSNLSSPNKYRPTSPSKYSPKSPNKYQPTSPNKYYPTSPIKYSPISPNRYESTSPHKYRPTSPNKYLSQSPGTYRSTSPNKYRPTSPNKYHPKSPNTHRPTSPDKYFSSSPDKYQATSPTKSRPTSSSYTYPSKETNMKAQNLPRQNKYRPTSPTKYLPTSPTHNYPSKEDHMSRSQDLPVSNKYRSTSPLYRYPSNEGQPIRTQKFSVPNKNHSSSLGAEGGQVVDFSSPKNHWLSAGPPTTRHPLTTPTNNINEALGFLMESYSPRSHPTREESFDILPPRAQPTEHERRYARTGSGGVTNRPYLRSNAIDSDEAVRRYNGAYVP